MASIKPSLRQFSTCLRCVRQAGNSNGSLNRSPLRLFSTTPNAWEEVSTQPTTPAAAVPPPPPPPAKDSPASETQTQAEPHSRDDLMKKWGTLDPKLVENKRDERRLLRREGLQPIGSRRRRAVLHRNSIRNTPEVPFEQLPYQCFQEARKILAEDRQEKIKAIETQTLRLNNLMAQDVGVSGGKAAKEARIRSMQNRIDELVILADINDPLVKKNFEDGTGDMNKPIYRYLADQKWRKYKRLILEQRVQQLNLVPDLLPALDLKVDIDLAFGRKKIAPGEFVDSRISETLPRLTVQSFEPGQKLVTVVVVDPDVPVPDKNSFTYRCHFIATNIPISPTETSIPLTRIEHDDVKATDAKNKKIALSWSPPWANKGAPYHRLAIFILEQEQGNPLSVEQIKKTKRQGFILRSFVDKYKLKPIGATLFRTKWDENMAGVMERAGLADQINIEFKRQRVEPLPYKRRTERMR
ncbi:PEBP-like protein [Pleomassaria siparia CBS 279.74]|uniref:Large ribosomal subunit protein mL38 n=1 Tax=Pleomassaria siparia CBS 279.74 TaxID=1314801 RepID=A0A6G1KCT6_9PLEO|nr:PEBP-like protein [Pleomassaria siparia CBS 279.74]